MKAVGKWGCVAGILALVGCSSFSENGGYSEADREMEEIIAATNAMPESPIFDGEEQMNWQDRAMMAKRTYYFDFDRYQIRDEDKVALESHVRYLLNHPDAMLRVEGHTDERGSREYNVGLGERRAKSVYNFFVSRGIDENRVAVVSYGKEKPADPRHLDQAWERNRRATIVYEVL